MEQSLPSVAGMPEPAEFDRIAEALGPAGRVAYAPPHVYPMSAPAFQKSPCAERERPTGNLLGLYVHVPFCNYACSFCFYAKRVGDDYQQMQRYVEALKKELAWVEPGTQLSQLYVGGGTPTALPAELLDDVLTAVFQRMSAGNGVHTVECSPESITVAHVRVLCERGVGRVSLGIQSLSDHVLDQVHRRHRGEDALASCDLLVQSGLTVNVDLIYGLPEQTEASFRKDFEALARRGVHSITTYNLRVNERTPVAKGIKEDERLDLARLMRWRAFVNNTAEELGFKQTRWHLFERTDKVAKPQAAKTAAAKFEDKTGQGNQFGIGMSARSRLGATVYRNHPDIHVYLGRVETGQSPVEEIFPLGEADRKIRFIAQSIGDGKPLDRPAYERTFGRSLDDEFAEPIRRLTKAGLLEETAGQVSLTETGKLVHDLVTLGFYPKHVRDWLREREQAAVARIERLTLK